MAKVAPSTIAPQLVALTALHPAPWNPRSIRDVRFKQLCESIQADPDFLWRRPILANLAGEIYGGNMRYRAVEHLGWQEVPAIRDDISDKLAKERALKDNNNAGDFDDQATAELLVGLQMDGSDLRLLGFPDDELTRLLESVGALGDTLPATGLAYEDAERGKTPEEKLELWEVSGIRQIVLHFELPEYQAVMTRLDALRDARGLATNAEVVAAVLLEACPEVTDATARA